MNQENVFTLIYEPCNACMWYSVHGSLFVAVSTVILIIVMLPPVSSTAHVQQSGTEGFGLSGMVSN